MKKLLLSILVFASVWGAAAQQVQNNDFENWTQYTESTILGSVTYDSLDNWTSSNDIANQQQAGIIDPNVGPETDASYVTSGSTSANMETVNCAICGTLGLPTEIPGALIYEDTYTMQPESFSFDYRYDPVNGDWAAAAVLLTNSVSGDTIAIGLATIEAQATTMTNISMPLSYINTGTPDNITVIFASSAEFFLDNLVPNVPAPQVGSSFWVDNLQFIMPVAGTASPVGNILANDIADNGNGLDLEFEFSAVQDETTINEYRVMAVKEADAATFDLTAAQGATEYYAITPVASPISTTFLATSNDVDGDPIQNGQPYRIFVMSDADGTNATIDNLSPMSNSVTLNAQPADTAVNVLSADINNNGDGSDLDVQFEPAADENTVNEYRIMVVKATNAGAFNLAAAEAVASANYATHTPDGMIYQNPMGAGALDTDGDAIAENVPYRVFVLSMADGTNASLNALSNPSNEVELTNPASTEDFNKETWSIYPNPVEAKLSLNLNGNATVTVMDMIGNVVYEKNVINSTTIPTGSFEKGAYLIQVELNGQTKTKKFIKK